MSELHQTPTQFEDLNALLHKSPLSRPITTYRQMVDPRKTVGEKSINALIGGVKTTDIDYSKALEYEGRRLLEELLEKVPESKSFSRLSIPPEELAKLSPEELKQYSLYQHLLKISQKRSAAKKKAEAAAK